MTMLPLLPVLSVLLVLAALAVLRVSNLLSLIVVLSIYSGLIMTSYALLGAVDVAFTEAIVGLSLSTIFFMTLIGRLHMRWINPVTRSRRILGGAVALGVAAVLFLGIQSLPPFGEAEAVTHTHVADEYIARSEEDMHTPNVVSAVLADYRGFDTLIETSVVFTAALVCMLVLGGGERPRRPAPGAGGDAR